MAKAEEVKEKLQELSDEKYRKFHSSLCPNTREPILGVRIPILRKYAKELKNKYGIEIINEIGEEYYEEIMLKGMLIGLQNNVKYEAIEKQIKNFVPKIDNWAICDTFCAGLKITKKYKNEMLELIQSYLNSKKEFELRFAIVMLLDYYIDEEHINIVLNVCDNVKHEGYYVKMAIAWAISICLIKFYDETKKYLNNSNLDDFTYNKSLQKALESYRISESKKLELRNMKRMGKNIPKKKYMKN